MSSTGDVVVLTTLLAVVVARPAAVGAVAFAGFAVVERWGTTSLDAVAGAQSVLGPGGLIGPPPGAASAWCAAAALVLASPWVDGDDAPGPPRRRILPAAVAVAIATGSAAAAAVAGPHFATDFGVRAVATVAAVVVAANVASSRWPQVTAALALAIGAIGAVLASMAATARVGL